MKRKPILSMTPTTDSKKVFTWKRIFLGAGALFFVFFLYLGFGPRVSGGYDRLKKNNVGQNAKSIAVTYLYALHNNIPISSDQIHSPAQMASFLARLNNPMETALWYIENDRALNKQTIPRGNGFTGAVLHNDLEKIRPISWAIVLNISREKLRRNSYPILWTRGLQPDGTWAKDSPWQGEGGHVAFADGHVQWFENLNSEGNRLIDFTTGKETPDFRRAIGPDAVVVEDAVPIRR